MIYQYRDMYFCFILAHFAFHISVHSIRPDLLIDETHTKSWQIDTNWENRILAQGTGGVVQNAQWRRLRVEKQIPCMSYNNRLRIHSYKARPDAYTFGNGSQRNWTCTNFPGQTAYEAGPGDAIVAIQDCGKSEEQDTTAQQQISVSKLQDIQRRVEQITCSQRHS